MKIEERVKKTMSIVFNISIEDINGSSSPDTIEEWSSLAQLNLIMSLEEEFNVSFGDEQVFEMISYPLIILTIKEVLNQ